MVEEQKPVVTERRESPTSAIVAYALATRKDEEINREMKKGLNKHTEHYAYPHVLPRVPHISQEDRVLRIAGLIASESRPYDAEVDFGRWLNEDRDAKKENIENRLLRLMNLNFDQAIDEIVRLFKLTGNPGGLNWYRLAETLFFWGDGVSDGSLKTRQSILRDYYRSDFISTTDVDGEEEKK